MKTFLQAVGVCFLGVGFLFVAFFWHPIMRKFGLEDEGDDEECEDEWRERP